MYQFGGCGLLTAHTSSQMLMTGSWEAGVCFRTWCHMRKHAAVFGCRQMLGVRLSFDVSLVENGTSWVRRVCRGVSVCHLGGWELRTRDIRRPSTSDDAFKLVVDFTALVIYCPRLASSQFYCTHDIFACKVFHIFASIQFTHCNTVKLNFKLLHFGTW